MFDWISFDVHRFVYGFTGFDVVRPSLSVFFFGGFLTRCDWVVTGFGGLRWGVGVSRFVESTECDRNRVAAIVAVRFTADWETNSALVWPVHFCGRHNGRP